MINSKFAPINYDILNIKDCMVNNQGVQQTISNGITGNIDLKLTDDHLLTGVQVIVDKSVFGDTLNLQVCDKDLMLQGVYGAAITTMYPNYPILRQFATNWVVNSDCQIKISKEKLYPAKIYAGLYLRCSYTSTGTVPVNVAVNYDLHICLN